MKRNKLNTQYFDVHCQFENSGYSIPVMMHGYRKQDEQSIKDHCKNERLFVEEGDDEFVDNITEIDKDEYDKMNN